MSRVLAFAVPRPRPLPVPGPHAEAEIALPNNGTSRVQPDSPVEAAADVAQSAAEQYAETALASSLGRNLEANRHHGDGHKPRADDAKRNDNFTGKDFLRFGEGDAWQPNRSVKR